MSEHLKALADAIEAHYNPGAHVCPGYDAHKVMRILRAALSAEPPAGQQDEALTVEQLALEECLQLGYSIVDGTLRPPESAEWSALATSSLRARG